MQMEIKMKKSSLLNEIKDTKLSGSGLLNTNSISNQSGHFYRGIKYSEGANGRI